MPSALHGLRAAQPAKLVCAVPVAPPDTLLKVARLADEVVCLEAPEFFQAVGQFYPHFPQVEDDEVANTLVKMATANRSQATHLAELAII